MLRRVAECPALILSCLEQKRQRRNHAYVWEFKDQRSSFLKQLKFHISVERSVINDGLLNNRPARSSSPKQHAMYLPCVAVLVR